MEYIKTTNAYGLYLDTSKTYGSLNFNLFNKRLAVNLFYSLHQFNLGVHAIFTEGHYSIDLNLGFVSVGIRF